MAPPVAVFFEHNNVLLERLVKESQNLLNVKFVLNPANLGVYSTVYYAQQYATEPCGRLTKRGAAFQRAEALVRVSGAKLVVLSFTYAVQLQSHNLVKKEELRAHGRVDESDRIIDLGAAWFKPHDIKQVLWYGDEKNVNLPLVHTIAN